MMHLLRARMHPAWTALPNRLRFSTGASFLTEGPASGRSRSGALPAGRLRTLATAFMNNPGSELEPGCKRIGTSALIQWGYCSLTLVERRNQLRHRNIRSPNC